jgi:nucleoside-diphosphate-sugar epimerase
VANALVAVAAARGRVVVGGGEQQRPHVHVEDLCDLWLLLLEADPAVVGGETFNALGQNVSIAELAALARAVVGPHVELEFRPRRADERSYQVSGDKAARVLGWRARRPLRDALQGIVDARAAGLWSDVDDPIHHNLRRMQAIGVGGPS